MRVLRFIVDAQHVHKDPECDFSKIVAGTKNYLKAHFTFSPEWSDCLQVASFWRGGDEHAAIVQNGICEIPYEALVGRTFGVSLIGQKDGYRITTDRIIVRQEVS